MYVCVKAGFIGEEKAVPDQTVDFAEEKDASGMAVYVTRADCSYRSCVAVSSPDSPLHWILYKEMCGSQQGCH